MNQEPQPPLLQTVCHASLLSLVTLMADHVEQLDQVGQLSRLGFKKVTRVSIKLPKMRCEDQLLVRKNDEIFNGGEFEIDKFQLDSSDVISVSDKARAEAVLFTEGDKRGLPDLVLPCAPIYSFDEDGEILQQVNIITPSSSEDCGYHSGPSETLYDDGLVCNDHINDPLPLPVTSTPDTELSVGVDSWPGIEQLYIVRGDGEASNSSLSIHPFITSAAELQSFPNIDDTPTDIILLTQTSSLNKDETQANAKGIPDIKVVTETETMASPETIPKIDFQAASIEIVDDYLEDNCEENQLRDLCSTILGDTASWQGSRSTSSRNYVQGLLNAAPHDASSRRQRVPFHTVVFTERKPSTGDALVLSLGLAAHGASTIQDIASRNQGAARERLQQQQQQGEMLPSENKLMRECESCGVSPEDCLKKLGLHSDHVGSLSPSPKSERLLQFFRNIQPVAPRPLHAHTQCGSDQQLDQIQQPAPKCQSRSLTSSPAHSNGDSRKPRLNTF